MEDSEFNEGVMLSHRRHVPESRPLRRDSMLNRAGNEEPFTENIELHTLPSKQKQTQIEDEDEITTTQTGPYYPEEDPDKYPPKRSIALILINNLMSEMSATTALPISAAYTQYLGGTDAFSGLVIGIPTLVSLVLMYPMLRFANPKSANGYTLYFRPMFTSCFAHIIGHLLYSLAYRAHWIYLILIGRMFNGIGFTMFLYHKKYLSDKEFVGRNKSTFLSTLNILAQTLGFMSGAFIGGTLAKASRNIHSPYWNEYTAGSWFMLIAWGVYMVFLKSFFIEILPENNRSVTHREGTSGEQTVRLSLIQKIFVSFLFLTAFVCYFTIMGYQTSIPIYAGRLYNYNAFQTGNFLALSSLVIAPFILLSTFLSKWLEDRQIMLLGVLIGIIALVLHLILDAVHKIPVQPYFLLYSVMSFGFSVGSAPLVSLSSKQLHPKFQILVSIVVQVGVSLADTVGAITGGAIYNITTIGFIAMNLGLAVLVFIELLCLWNSIKEKTT
ncbi:MFS transporter [Schizosaccharomyces cryophilus OY26]|uniref:MFS transporter n=1 Tax=Schizosaccharomyces cryophilus (strain OY26 / ATCC MYA-4695 / CBS 11777 / NBRC 106824 / NRRL Y48691) TaxID=653667 RepID=S9W2N6_SCHCR|nr:MFS transporter [Schizosaccharomyces cryophilus OY26]EPY52739.1 MFS transporter [Schizosaccharomyces cryophilus OY26]